jgi:hypothetical protein
MSALETLHPEMPHATSANLTIEIVERGKRGPTLDIAVASQNIS